MESKITSLIFLSREYNQSSDEDINLTVEEGKPTVYVMGDRYQANSWEEVLDKAIRTITRWIEEEKEANRKEIEEEAIIAKIWEVIKLSF